MSEIKEEGFKVSFQGVVGVFRADTGYTEQ